MHSLWRNEVWNFNVHLWYVLVIADGGRIEISSRFLTIHTQYIQMTSHIYHTHTCKHTFVPISKYQNKSPLEMYTIYTHVIIDELFIDYIIYVLLFVCISFACSFVFQNWQSTCGLVHSFSDEKKENLTCFFFCWFKYFPLLYRFSMVHLACRRYQWYTTKTCTKYLRFLPLHRNFIFCCQSIHITGYYIFNSTFAIVFAVVSIRLARSIG